jgi:ketosteroid isomerase-like protein
MSQENVELLRDVFNRWNEADRTFGDEEVHPDVVLMSRGIMAGHPVSGREGLRAWFRDIDEQFGEFRLTVARCRRSRGSVGAYTPPRQGRRHRIWLPGWIHGSDP